MSQSQTVHKNRQGEIALHCGLKIVIWGRCRHIVAAPSPCLVLWPQKLFIPLSFLRILHYAVEFFRKSIQRGHEICGMCDYFPGWATIMKIEQIFYLFVPI